jgi:hypothetical protein
MFKKRRTFSVTAMLLALLTQPAFPTTVAPMSFDQLVQQAEIVFIGDVIDQRSVWDDSRDGRRIVTQVTFDVVRVLKGTVGLRTQLSFQGGTVGDVTQEITGMPKFRPGDRDVLFVSPDRNAVSPLVGFWQGRFRVVRDAATGAMRVRMHDGGSLISGWGGTVQPAPAAGVQAPLALSEFETLVRARVAERSKQQ